jgi:outer membrane protein OmpA-like peptidoglycan-associated protein
MRRNSGMTGVQAVMVGSLIACFVSGQATEKRQETEVLRQQAETAASRGEWSDAASLYQSAIAWERDAAWAHRGLADVYRANGVWDKAEEQYDAASTIDPADAATKQLALLSRQATTEERADFVRAGTFRAMAQLPLAWPQNRAEKSRDLGFQPKPQASTVQRIPLPVAFPRDKYTLDSLPLAATRELEEVAAMIGTDSDRPLKIEVEGHTCRCGSDAANLELGRKRAEAVREFLVAKRAAPPDTIIAISFGSSRPVESAGAPSLPVAVCERDEIHSRNRRIVIVLYGQFKAQTKAAPRLDVSFLSRRVGKPSYDALPDGGQLRNGDEYRINLHAQTPVYAYAFHRGSSGKWDILFPDTTGRGQYAHLSNPLESGQDVSIPTPDAGFVLTGDPGLEETYVYSSQEPNYALEALVRNVQDGADVKLLPPTLTLAGPEVRARRGGQTGNGPSVKPTPPKPSGQPVEFEEAIKMRGLQDTASEAKSKDLGRPWDQSRLPPEPTAYVRFLHVK